MAVLFAVGCNSGVAAGKDRAAVASPLPAVAVASDFWDTWGDGRAEVSSYQLTTPRYGELREGHAVLVFVTEDFTDGQRVKSDGGHGDEYPVLKLNDVRAYQTGVYDYRVTTSSFVRLDGADPLGRAVKVSMGMQEWCGHVYSQVIPRAGALDVTTHSYFDGEGDQSVSLDLPATGVQFDALPITARGLTGDWPGEVLPVEVLTGLARARYEHRPLAFRKGELRRGPSSTVTVPAGAFEVRDVLLVTDALTVTWQVEVAPPHRLIGWTTSDGELAQLVGTKRIPYWQLNAEGAESELAELGLSPVTAQLTTRP